MGGEALDTPQVTSLSIAMIVGLLLAAAVLTFIVRKMIARVLILVVAVVLVGVVWKQQHAVENNACKANPTFFGVHLSTDVADLSRRCPDPQS